MADWDYKKIDNLLHSRIRLAVVSLLAGCQEAEFTFIRDTIGATDGNMSSHMKKLEEKNYIKIRKEFVNRKPVTYYSLTSEGQGAFENYVKSLSGFLRQGINDKE